jgi:hypothetical protein
MTERQSEYSGDVTKIRRFVSFVGICVLLLSQLLVFSKPVSEEVALPPYTSLGLLGVVILIAGQWIPSTAFWQRAAFRPIFDDRAFWVIAAVSLSAMATTVTASFMAFTRLNYIPVLTVWFLAAACYVYAQLRPDVRVDLASISGWLKANRNEILIVMLIALCAAATRFYRLGEVPRVLDGDEGSVGLFAKATGAGTLANPFALWENFGALYMQLINVSMKLFGETPLGLRLMPAVGGVLAVPAVYLLARRIGGRRIALIAAVMIAISHSHLHFSRIASVAYIQDTWLIPLELYFLISGLEKKESWRTALGGILLAVHYSFYLTAQIITALVILFMLIAFAAYRAWFRERISQALVFWGGFLLMILPSALYVSRHPNEFLNRLGSSGTFQTGWLQSTMQATGQSAVEALSARVLHAFLALIYYPAYDFYGSPTPMMSMISSALLLTGLGIILWRIRNPSYLLLNGYFWGATVAVGLFALPPSADSYRMLMALPAAVIIAALGLDQILEIINLGWNQARAAYTFTVAALLTSLLFFNLWTYYAEFAGQCRFASDSPGRFASYLGSELQEIDNENQVYLLSDEVYFHGSHPSTLFLSRNRSVVNIPDPVEGLTPVSGETVIASPQRITELEAWARANPGGTLHYASDCGTIILLSYRVP